LREGHIVESAVATLEGEAMHVWSYEVASPGVASYAEDRTTRRLLLCGIVAGPVFVAAGLLQSFTIPGSTSRITI
jgi:hypothetical protein